MQLFWETANGYNYFCKLKEEDAFDVQSEIKTELLWYKDNVYLMRSSFSLSGNLIDIFI